MQEEQEVNVGRRRLMRGAGAVIAGVAGAGVAGAVVATPAEATQGSAVLAGVANDETDTTGIELAGAATPEAKSALRLTNAAGAGLTIDPVDSAKVSTAPPVGSIFVDQFGDITTVGNAATGKFNNLLYSPTWATMQIPVTPTRWLDTRGGNPGTAFVVPGSGTIASQKISPKGSATDADLMLDFSSLLVDNYVAVQMTISVVGSANDGWLTVWGDGPFPGAVSVNFLAGRVIGGFTHSELTGVYAGSTEPFGRLKIKVTHPVSVTVDIVGFITPDVRTLFKPEAAAAATSMAPATPSRVPKVAPRKR